MGEGHGGNGKLVNEKRYSFHPDSLPCYPFRGFGDDSFCDVREGAMTHTNLAIVDSTGLQDRLSSYSPAFEQAVFAEIAVDLRKRGVSPASCELILDCLEEADDDRAMAFLLKLKGQSETDIAESIGVSRVSLWKWRKSGSLAGLSSLLAQSLSYYDPVNRG